MAVSAPMGALRLQGLGVFRVWGGWHDDSGGSLDCSRTAAGNGRRIVGNGSRVGRMCPRQANPEQHDEQVEWLPGGIRISIRLGLLDRRDGAVDCRFAIGQGLIESHALQSGPIVHPDPVRLAERVVVDISDDLGDGFGSHGQRTKELGRVHGHDGSEKCLLVAEVGVQTLFAGVGGAGNAINPGAGQAMLGEFGPGRRHDCVS